MAVAKKRRRWKNLSKKKKQKLYSHKRNAGLTKKQVRKKYNKKAKNHNLKIKRTKQDGIFGQKKESKWNRLLTDSSDIKPDGLGPTFGTSAQRNQKKDKWGRVHRNISDAFLLNPKKKTKWHPPLALPKKKKGLVDKEPKPGTVHEPVDEELVGDMEFGIQKGAMEFDWDKFLSGFKMEDPNENIAELEMPKMPGIRTDISGGSAGGIRRRRSKRSQMGMNAMGTRQLNRAPGQRLSLGGINY